MPLCFFSKFLMNEGGPLFFLGVVLFFMVLSMVAACFLFSCLYFSGLSVFCLWMLACRSWFFCDASSVFRCFANGFGFVVSLFFLWV